MATSETFDICINKLYSIPQVAAYFEVSKSTIYRWIDEGKLKVVTRRINNRQAVKGRELLSKLQSIY